MQLYIKTAKLTLKQGLTRLSCAHVVLELHPVRASIFCWHIVLLLQSLLKGPYNNNNNYYYYYYHHHHRRRHHHLFGASRPALRSTQPPIQCVCWGISQG